MIAPLAFALVVAAAPFASHKEGVLVVDRPATAVAVLTGACEGGDLVDQAECAQNTKGLQAELQKKRVSIDLGAGHEAFLHIESVKGGQVKVVWAPLIDVGNGRALTIGKPSKLSDSGNVVVKQRPFQGALIGDASESDLMRQAKLGQIGVEVVGHFGKPWQLAGGGKTVRGVAFEPEALRFYVARTGKTFAEIELK
jgi:hypothetical protein